MKCFALVFISTALCVAQSITSPSGVQVTVDNSFSNYRPADWEGPWLTDFSKTMLYIKVHVPESISWQADAYKVQVRYQDKDGHLQSTGPIYIPKSQSGDTNFPILLPGRRVVSITVTEVVAKPSEEFRFCSRVDNNN